MYIAVSSYLYRCNIYMYVRYIAARALAVTKMVSSPFDFVPFRPPDRQRDRDAAILFTREMDLSYFRGTYLGGGKVR